MKDALIVSLLSVVPKNHASWTMGAFTRLRLPRWAHRLLIGWFAKKYGVDLSECDRPLDDYETFSDFFVRALRPGARPIDAQGDLTSPVDGKVHAIGRIERGSYHQADEHRGLVATMLGPDAEKEFEGGTCAILYLAPHNYHRVHAPCSARVRQIDYHPGHLWPVFPAATRKVPELFGRNERLVFWLDTDAGRIALVMVGAYGVGRMSTPLDPIVTNTGRPAVTRPGDTQVHAGDELGRFGLGSTVIVVTQPGALAYAVHPGDVIRMGQALAAWTALATTPSAAP